MSEEKNTFLVRVDIYGKWTPTDYRKVTKEELDELIDTYGGKVKELCSSGERGAMTMWAYFKNKIDKGCYSDIINAYRLLNDDSKSLVEREHEFRHLFDQYTELWRIRHYGSVEKYHLAKAEEAKGDLIKYVDKNGGL